MGFFFKECVLRVHLSETGAREVVEIKMMSTIHVLDDHARQKFTRMFLKELLDKLLDKNCGFSVRRYSQHDW